MKKNTIRTAPTDAWTETSTSRVWRAQEMSWCLSSWINCHLNTLTVVFVSPFPQTHHRLGRYKATQWLQHDYSWPKPSVSSMA